MAPKRKTAGKKAQAGEAKRSKTHADGDAKAIADSLLAENTSYCEELGIDLRNGGPGSVFQWLLCSEIFAQRLSEKTTIRAAKGLIKSGLTDPKSVRDIDFKTKIDALNSEGNVQRGPTMASRLEATSALLLERYEGDMSKLREAAGRDPTKERKLVKQFKGFGDVAVNIFCREAQLAWEELFPFADKNTLDMAAQLGLPGGSAKELANLVDNDRDKFVKLLAAVVKQNLRGGRGKGEEDAAGEDAGEQQDPANGEDAGKQEDPAPAEAAEKPEAPADGKAAGELLLPADDNEGDDEGPVDAADEERAAADDEDYDEEEAASDDEDYDEDEE